MQVFHPIRNLKVSGHKNKNGKPYYVMEWKEGGRFYWDYVPCEWFKYSVQKKRLKFYSDGVLEEFLDYWNWIVQDELFPSSPSQVSGNDTYLLRDVLGRQVTPRKNVEYKAFWGTPYSVLETWESFNSLKNCKAVMLEFLKPAFLEAGGILPHGYTKLLAKWKEDLIQESTPTSSGIRPQHAVEEIANVLVSRPELPTPAVENVEDQDLTDGLPTRAMLPAPVSGPASVHEFVGSGNILPLIGQGLASELSIRASSPIPSSSVGCVALPPSRTPHRLNLNDSPIDSSNATSKIMSSPNIHLTQGMGGGVELGLTPIIGQQINENEFFSLAPIPVLPERLEEPKHLEEPTHGHEAGSTDFGSHHHSFLDNGQELGLPAQAERLPLIGQQINGNEFFSLAPIPVPPEGLEEPKQLEEPTHGHETGSTEFGSHQHSVLDGGQKLDLPAQAEGIPLIEQQIRVNEFFSFAPIPVLPEGLDEPKHLDDPTHGHEAGSTEFGSHHHSVLDNGQELGLPTQAERFPQIGQQINENEFSSLAPIPALPKRLEELQNLEEPNCGHAGRSTEYDSHQHSALDGGQKLDLPTQAEGIPLIEQQIRENEFISFAIISAPSEKVEASKELVEPTCEASSIECNNHQLDLNKDAIPAVFNVSTPKSSGKALRPKTLNFNTCGNEIDSNLATPSPLSFSLTPDSFCLENIVKNIEQQNCSTQTNTGLEFEKYTLTELQTINYADVLDENSRIE